MTTAAAATSRRNSRQRGQTDDEIIARAEEADRDKVLGTDGCKEFARLLCSTVDGTKAKMLKHFKEVINQMAVTHGQTRF